MHNSEYGLVNQEMELLFGDITLEALKLARKRTLDGTDEPIEGALTMFPDKDPKTGQEVFGRWTPGIHTLVRSILDDDERELVNSLLETSVGKDDESEEDAKRTSWNGTELHPTEEDHAYRGPRW